MKHSGAEERKILLPKFFSCLQSFGLGQTGYYSPVTETSLIVHTRVLLTKPPIIKHK